MKIDFWLLSRDPAERVVAMIAERVLAGGERALVVAEDAAQREEIGGALWEAKPEAFLANGQAGGNHDPRQPILLSDTWPRLRKLCFEVPPQTPLKNL